MRRYLYLIYISALSFSFAACSGSSTGKEEEHHGHAHGATDELELSAEQIKAVDIQFGEVSLVNLGSTIKTTGELAVDPQDEAVVSPLSSGIIRRLLVKTGDRLAKGTVVAYVENPDAVTLQQEYLIAAEEEVLARQELQRQETLAREGAGIRKNLQQAKANLQIASTRTAALGRRLAAYGINPSSIGPGRFVTEIPVKSPISGVVTDVMASTGSFADSSMPMMRIVNNSGIYCRLNIFEKNLSQVEPGRQVDIRLTNRPDMSPLDGEVVSVTEAFNGDTKSLIARVRLLSSGDELLVPGMAVTGYISSHDEEVTALPDGAIVTAEGKSYVFMVNGSEEEDGKVMTHFRKVEVITGIKERGFTGVRFLEAPAPGTRFVVKNAFYLGSMSTDHGAHSH